MIDLVQIKQKIQQTFSPVSLDIVDESHQHAGHSGAIPGQITHLRINICSELFSDINTIKQHRLVNQCLQEEFEQGLHALSLKTYTVKQWTGLNNG
ncbi:BolA family protein [Lentisphaera profundi]|uniref:BolA family protein n=1 Tax=Lentisphaera profundi TaxID=1658616 RepID=UPI003B683C20